MYQVSKCRLCIILLGFIVIVLNSCQTQKSEFHIYLAFGQSNTEGQGLIEDIDKDVDSRFVVFQSLDCPDLNRVKDTWYPAVPPLCQCHTGLSPSDYFGRTMVENAADKTKVGIINVAVGGCDIRLFDKDIYENYKLTHKGDWFMNKINNYGGNPYEHLINLSKQAQQDGVIKGIILHQGETNTGDEEWPQYVKKIYNDILSDLNLNAKDVPLIAGEVVSIGENCCSSMNTIINKLPTVIETAHVVSSEGCTSMDRAHFDSEGYRELGRRYAKKMIEVQAK